MSLTLVTKARNSRLVQVSTVKALLGITDSDSDDVLALLADGASAAINRELGRELARATWTETLQGRDQATLLLSQRPVDRDSITLTVDGVAETDWTFQPSGRLWREDGWEFGDRRDDDPEENVSVQYTGGYLMPGDVATFAATTAYALNAWVKPTSPHLSPWLFQASVAGTSGGTEPTWPSTSGQTVVSGTATFIARDAVELPSDVVLIAAATVRDLWEKRGTATGLSGWQAEGFQETFFASAYGGTLIPEFAKRHLASLHWE